MSSAMTTFNGISSSLTRSTVCSTPLSRTSKSPGRDLLTGLPFWVTSTSTRTDSTLVENDGVCAEPAPAAAMTATASAR